MCLYMQGTVFTKSATVSSPKLQPNFGEKLIGCWCSLRAYVTSYVMSLAFLAASGYTVVLVNFRGSTGYGEENVQSLLGSVGENDVADCIAALDAAEALGAVKGLGSINMVTNGMCAGRERFEQSD